MTFADQSKSKNVLLLEDNKSFRDTLTNLIESTAAADLKVLPVSNLQAAVETVHTVEKIDLLLIDLKLEGSSTGLDFLRKLQELGKLSRVPKIVLSDLSKDDISVSGRSITIEELKHAGMHDYIEKRAVWADGNNNFIHYLSKLLFDSHFPDISHTETDSAYIVFLTAFFCGTSGLLVFILGEILNLRLFGEFGIWMLALSMVAIGASALIRDNARNEQASH